MKVRIGLARKALAEVDKHGRIKFVLKYNSEIIYTQNKQRPAPPSLDRTPFELFWQMFTNQTPSITSTSGIYGNGTQAYAPQNPNLVFNINSNNSPSPTFIPMNNSTFQPGGNGGFSSPSNGSHQTPRDILTRQQLIFYFCHSSVCLVKNGNNAKAAMASNCKVPYCPESKHVLQHLQLCANSRGCGVSSCLGLRWARDHYSNCKNMSCVMCEPVRKNRAAFVCSVQSPQSNSDFRKSLKDWIMSEEPLTRNDNGAGRKNPRFELNKKARLSTIANMVSAIIPRGDSANGGQGSLLASEEQTRKVIDLTRQVELDVYYDAADKDEYFEKMACRSYEFQKRMEDLQRTKNEELQHQQQQQQMQQQPPPPPAIMLPIQSATGLNVAEAASSSSSSEPAVSVSAKPADDVPVGETSKMNVDSNKSILSSLLNKESSPAMLNSPHMMNNNNNCPKTPQEDDDIKSGKLPLPPPQSAAAKGSNDKKESAETVEADVVNKMDTNSETVVKEEPGIDENSTKMETDTVKAEPSTASSSQATSPKVKEEPEVAPSSDKAEVTPTPPAEVKKKVFTIDEIRQSLWPVLQHIIGQPESEPFRVPVDYMTLGLTDYPEVVKEPMDISTIRKNMFEDHYSDDPWKFIQHMQLMFSNAWLYNRKATKIYKSTTRLSEIFYEKIDDAMRSLGFCCGQHYTFSPIPIYCYQKLCHIPRDAKYFVWTNSAPKTGILSEKYIYCSKCFNETSSGLDNDEFPVSDEPGVAGAQILNVPKSAFEQVTNNNVESEKFVECVDCGRSWHVICAMYLQAISAEFHCPTCLKLQGITSGYSLSQTQELTKFSASRLPTNKMAAFIERSVNKQLKIADCPHVSIRVLSCCNKIAEVQPKMQARFPEYPKQFPYRHKALFAFTQVDSRDVCIFGMTVQEYGSDCPQPNTRRVYLSYLDSVFFFEPRSMRTTLYHRILIAYFDYCKQLGYDYAHIWACPPGEGDDYIFHCHPPEQKTPKPKRLQDWYKSMLDQALQEGVIEDYKDIQKACEDSNPAGFTSATQLPYFEGDYWPKVLEDLITQVGDSNSSSSSKNVSTSAASITAANEEEIHSVESDPAMTPGAQDMEQQCATPNPSGNDEIASTPPSTNVNNNETGNGASNANNSNDKTQKQPRKKSKKWSGGSSSRHKQRKPATLDLTEKVMQNMTSCRDSFFTIRLQTYKGDSVGSDTERSPDNRSLTRESSSRKKIEEPDPDVHYELMEGRDSFLHMSREKYWEFSSLRRAKYSTMCMVHELHTATNSLMDNKSNNADSKTDANNGSSNANSATSKAEMMSQWIKVLVHATTCRNANCNNPAQCPNFKQLLSHAKSCAQRNNQQKQTSGSATKANAVGCITCTNLFKMFIKHAETCNKGNQPCTVPYCQDIRRRNSRQDLMLRRRMAMMMQRTNSVNGAQNQTPASAASANSPLSTSTPNNCSMNQQPRTPYTPSPSSNDTSNQMTSSTSTQQSGPPIVSQQVAPPPPTQQHPIVSTAAPRTSTQSQAPYNPPPAGALEAAQRAKKQAAMQSSCGTIVTQPGGYTVPNMGPVTSVPYHPGATMGLPAYQQSAAAAAGPSQTLGGATVGLPDGVTGANPSLVYHGPPTGVPGSDGNSPGAGSPMFLNGSPYAPQMIMVSSQQQMMRPGAPVYFPNAGNNQHQMQMSQIPMTQQHLRSQLIRGPMPSMGMMGPGSAPPGGPHGRMMMHGPSAYNQAYNPQQWMPMGANGGGGGGNPSPAAMGMSAGPPPQRIPVPVNSIRGPVSNTMMLINPNDPGGGAVVNPGQFMNNPGQIPAHFVNGNINAPGGVAPSPGGGFMQTNKANNPNSVTNNVVMNSGEELQKYADSL